VLRSVERPQQKPSIALVLVPSLAAIVIAAAFAFFLIVQHSNQRAADARARAAQSALQQKNAELQGRIAQILTQETAINQEKDQLIAELQSAKTKEDQDRINAQIADNQRRAAVAADQTRALQQQIRANTSAKPMGCKDNDPLCGL
jgi:hypothetical protein